VKITLARAMKAKKRLVQQIADCAKLIKAQNSIVVGNDRDIDIRETLEKRKKLVAKLVATKLAIEQASQPIRDVILYLAELKDEISMFKDLDCSRGKKADRSLYGDSTDLEYEAEITGSERLQKIEGLEAEIDELQTKIDVHNAQQTVEIPD